MLWDFKMNQKEHGPDFIPDTLQESSYYKKH
jgi:hypothetical protein